MTVDIAFFEREAKVKGFPFIAGIDEAGRGPLAGPVVSAAVILPDDVIFQNESEKHQNKDAVSGITDSKALTEKKRERLYDVIYENAVSIGIGIVDAVFIDRINILKASLLSMKIACDHLYPNPDFLLIDGKFEIDSTIPQKAVIKGDSKSISVAAASIIAKVTRDRLMLKYHEEYPEYGFNRHKGYPTRKHREIVHHLGPTPIHRVTFNGVLPDPLFRSNNQS